MVFLSLPAAIVLAGVLYFFLVTRTGELIRELPDGVDVRNGDIIVLGSSTLRGRLLKCIDGGTTWAHAGIAATTGGVASIIHADPTARGVVCETIADYLASNKVDSMAILRPRCGDGLKAVAYARELYDRNVPFDDLFRYRIGDGIYCTELVLLAWEDAGVVLMPEAKEGDSIRPSQIMSLPCLDTIWSSAPLR